MLGLLGRRLGVDDGYGAAYHATEIWRRMVVLLADYIRPGVKRYTVVLWNGSEGVRIVDGNAGWLGEPGKCWVSRQNPVRGP